MPSCTEAPPPSALPSTTNRSPPSRTSASTVLRCGPSSSFTLLRTSDFNIHALLHDPRSCKAPPPQVYYAPLGGKPSYPTMTLNAPWERAESSTWKRSGNGPGGRLARLCRRQLSFKVCENAVALSSLAALDMWQQPRLSQHAETALPPQAYEERWMTKAADEGNPWKSWF